MFDGLDDFTLGKPLWIFVVPLRSVLHRLTDIFFRQIVDAIDLTQRDCQRVVTMFGHLSPEFLWS